MEKIPTDEDDVPLQDITITGFTVFVNPFKDMIEEEEKKKAASNVTKAPTIDRLDQILGPSKPSSSGVGRYLQFSNQPLRNDPKRPQSSNDASPLLQPVSKKAKPTTRLTNFDAW